MADNVTDKSNPHSVDPKKKDGQNNNDDAAAKAAAAKVAAERQAAERLAAQRAEASREAAEKAHQSMIDEAMAAMRHLVDEAKHAIFDKAPTTETVADQKSQKLVDAGKLPSMTVADAAHPEVNAGPKGTAVDTAHNVKPTDTTTKVETPVEKLKPYDKPLTPEQKFFTDLYQQRLADPAVLAKITPEPAPAPGQSASDADKAYQKTLNDRVAAIQKEMGSKDDATQTWSKEPTFGPATQEAFRDYTNWLQKVELPNQAKELQSTGKEPPPGSPIAVPIENGKPISITEYQNRIATGKLTADLKIDNSAPPTEDEANRLEKALLWRNQAKGTNDDTKNERYDADVSQRIKELGLPSGWQYKAGEDKEAWRVAAGQMIDLSQHVGRMANLVNKLKLPVGQPPGSSVTSGRDGTQIKLDLPDNLRLDDPQTLAKVRALQEWETKVTPSLETVRTQLDAVANDPKKALAWGDTVINKVKDANGHEVSAKVELDKNGKLINIVDPTKPDVQPGSHTEDANLLAERFTAKTDPKTGEIIVTQDVQAQKTPWYSYENMIYSNIGKPADLPEKRYKPNDLVAVNKGNGTEFMLAKDLESYEKTSAALHYGEKALMATMDVAMIASGTIEVGAAIKGARLLVAAGEIAGNIGARDVLKVGAKGAWDLALGAGGITSSAELQSSTFGRELGNVRNIAFMSTLGVSAVKPGLKAYRFVTRGKGAAKTFEAVSEEAGGQAEVLKSGEGLKGIGDAATKGTKVADAPDVTTEAVKVTAKAADVTTKAADATTKAADATTKTADATTKTADAVNKVSNATDATTTTGAADATAKVADKTLVKPAEILKNENGTVRVTRDGELLTRTFDYGKDGSLEVLTIKKPDGDMVMRRIAGQDHKWSVKTADGRESTLEADIKANSDGSYTVNHTTDSNASWFKKAFNDGKPVDPIEKSVTYHPDGTITTKGIDADFKPPEGSTFRKEAKQGEYWTAPDGKQNWIDGSKILWQEKAAGVWQSQDGMMTELREFVKRDPIRATQITEPLKWTDTYNGVSTERIAKPGAWKVDEGNGKFYCIEQEKFGLLYEKAPGLDGQFVKRDFARAKKVQQDGMVNTDDGQKFAKVGDFLSYGPDGKDHLVTQEEWNRLYKESPKSAEARAAEKPFELPMATTTPQYIDGELTYMANGQKVSFSHDGTSVSIIDKSTGKASIYGTQFNPNAPVTYNFATGDTVMINNSGLRMMHTPEMGTGVFKGEDGSVLYNVANHEAGAQAYGYAWGEHPIGGVIDPKAISESIANYADFDKQKISIYTKPLEYGKITMPAVIDSLEKAKTGTSLTGTGGEVWTKVDDYWTSKVGTMRVTSDGVKVELADGTANWTDSNGTDWHRAASDPPKEWRTKTGAKYVEGTWNYIKRTKNDIQASSVLKGLQGLGALGALHPQMAAAQGANPDAVGTSTHPKTEGQPHHVGGEVVAAAGDSSHTGAEAVDDLKGPAAKAAEAIASKAMAYSTYPIIAQQLGDIASQGKQVTGQVLQSLGFQLNQMWAPKDSYAAASAAVDYANGQAQAAPEPKAVGDTANAWHKPAPIESAKSVADTLAEYKKAITQNIPDEWWGGNPTKNEVNKIFDQIAHAESPAGTQEERDKLKQSLASELTFNREELSFLNRLNHKPLTTDEVQTLMDPEKRKEFKNDIVSQTADRMMSSRNQAVVEASSAGLMFMADQEKTADPNSLGKTTMNLYGDLNYGANYGQPHAFGGTNYVINVSAGLAAANLKNAISQKSDDAKSLAYGDLLLKNGVIPPEQLGAIMQNVLSNPKSTTEDKMHALSDANGPRMGALIAGLAMQDSGVANADDKTFGSTIQDFEATLRNTAQNDSDPAIRAMSAGMVLAIGRFKAHSEDGAKIMDQLSALRAASETATPGQYGNLANNVNTLIATELAKTPGTDVAGSIAATQAYQLLEAHANPAEKQAMEAKISKSLLAALPNADATQTDAIAGALLPDRLKQINQISPAVADAARQQIITKLAVPADYSDDAQALMMSTLSKMPQLLDGASAATRNQLFDAAKAIVDNVDPHWSKLSIAAVATIKDAAAAGSASTLREMAANENSPGIRLAALQALDSMKDPQLAKIVDDRLGDGGKRSADGGIETDPDVVAHLQDLQYKLKESQIAAEKAQVLTDYQTSISERYPVLNSFDADKQKAWVAQNFPLLEKDNFIKAVQQATDGKQGNIFFDTADKAADKIDDQRQDQFDALVKVAGGDANSESTQQARRVLASMVAQNGGVTGHSENIPTGTYYMPTGDSGVAEIPTEYKEKAHDWAGDAAAALAKTANVGYTGRDLTAGLIGSILANNPPPAVRDSLARAWDLLAYSGNGVLVPRPVYDYVRRLPRP